MLKKNDIVTLTITDLTPEGAGVGKYEGYVVFVPKTAVGDMISARILKTLSSHGYGKCEEVLTASPDRREPDCAVFSKCGGCLFRHIRYDAELKIKKRWVEENFKRIGKLAISCDAILPSPAQDGYRNKAQIPCGKNENGLPVFGFYAPHSHRIIPCDSCGLQPPFYHAILRRVSAWMERFRIAPYEEEFHTGTVRHIFIRDGRASGEIMVCIVANADALPHTEELIRALLSENENITSIVLNVNKKPGNEILGRRCVTLYGKAAITDTLCGLVFDISPLSFYQVNHDGAEVLYGTAQEFAALTGKEILLDLYCGVGTIGLSMAKNAARLIGVEVVPAAVENARRECRTQRHPKRGIYLCRCGRSSRTVSFLRHSSRRCRRRSAERRLRRKGSRCHASNGAGAHRHGILQQRNRRARLRISRGTRICRIQAARRRHVPENWTCRMRGIVTKRSIVKIPYFRHFAKHFMFSPKVRSGLINTSRPSIYIPQKRMINRNI